MLEKQAPFSGPLIYFGSTPHQEGEDLDEEEYVVEHSWLSPFETNWFFPIQERVGLFIRWTDL